MMSMPSAPPLRLAALLLAGAALVSAASAKEDPVNPVVKRLQEIDFAPGVEHRLVIVHPILAQPRPVRRGEETALAGVATPDLLAFGRMEKSSPPRADAVNFAPAPAALLTGDVVRTETADYAVLRDVVAHSGAPVSTQFVRVSREVEADPKFAEPLMLGPVLPSAIRFLVLADASATEIREECWKWAQDAHLAATGRMSPVDLASCDLLKKRVADYRKALADAFKRPPAGGREVVGCAVLIEGAFASLDVFADGKSFAAAWPRLSDGVAVEAAVHEARARTLEADIPDQADPDRFLVDVKKRVLGAYGARPVEKDVKAEGKSIDLSFDQCLARALVLGEDRVVRFVLVTDPARRTDRRQPENPDPNAASRKMRPTEEEKRLIDRRDNGTPPTPPAPEPPPK